MPKTYKIKIDIKDITSHFEKPLVFVQYDHAQLAIEMTDNGQPYNLSTADRVEFTHIRKDGMPIVYPGEIVASNGGYLIHYEYQGTEMDVLGKVKTSFAIFDTDNKKVSSHSFDVFIDKDLREENANPAQPNYGRFQKLTEDVEYLMEHGGGGGGEPGPQGEPGPPGANGKTWHITATAPASSLGVVGDMHCNTATYDISEKTATTVWTVRGNIKGAPGEPGSGGGEGGGTQGPPGKDGKTWLSGTTAPANDAGTIGDFYLNTATCDVYEKTASSVWTLRVNIKGAQGIQGIQGVQGIPGTNGTNGKTWLTGTSAPSNSAGVVGDFYLNTSTWDVSEKTASNVWTLRGNIKGPQGIQGIQGIQGLPGTNGTNGTNGKTWLTGTSAPSNSAGAIGDFYLNTSTWDISEKTAATTWTVRGNIKGAQGATGPTANIDAHVSDYLPHDAGLSQYSSSIDSNGFYRVVEYKRPDNTLHLKSTASNPNAAGRYQTITWQFYAANGTTLELTKTWTITYDTNGVIVSKVLA